MTKRIVVCCDGTWNDPDSKTHIHWLCEHCVREDAEPLPQDVGYFAGVGTTPGEILSGGALGLGLSRNIRDAYRFVRERWQPGDELHIFGFSRGAYTARSLAGFIGLVGWLDEEAWVDPAYLWYRFSRPGPGETKPPLLGRLLAPLVERHIAERIPVNLLGVFDTVGALGIPFSTKDLAGDLGIDQILKRVGLDKLGELVNTFEGRIRWPIEGFHDTGLGAHVRNAYQALAVDEHRGPFLPTLWTQVPPTSTVEQSWFAGVHGDVGGGYHDHPDDGLLAADTLLWMMGKATALGLDLVPDALSELRAAADPLGPQHDSLTELWKFAIALGPVQAVDRPIGNPARLAADPSGQKFPQVQANETIHPSVRKRLGQQVEVRSEHARQTITYQPANLPVA
jgi:hypothetical protein